MWTNKDKANKVNKKLLIVIPYFIPAYGYGGPIKVAYDHAIWLQKLWYEVSVVTTDALDAKSRVTKLEETIDNIKIFRFKNINNKRAKFHNAYLPLWMKKRLKNNISNYDIVHIHDILNLPAIWASKSAKKNNIKYFIHPHGTLSDTRVQAKRSFTKKIVLKTFHKMLDQATGIFALTKQEETEIAKYSNNKNIFHLPNGLDLTEFENIQKIDLHKKYNLEKNCTIFTFLGRIQYIKGLDIAFKLLAEYNKINQNRVYLIIGPDEGEQDKLEKLAEELGIADKIIWYGMSSGIEKLSLLASGDVFLFTSRAEGFPMTILEALASGLPAFISTGCNLPEIKEAKCGSVVVNEEVGNNVRKLEEIVENKLQYNKNIEAFLNNYQVENILDKLISVYEK